jgi:hypothetical protein
VIPTFRRSWHFDEIAPSDSRQGWTRHQAFNSFDYDFLAALSGM